MNTRRVNEDDLGGGESQDAQQGSDGCLRARGDCRQGVLEPVIDQRGLPGIRRADDGDVPRAKDWWTIREGHAPIVEVSRAPVKALQRRAGFGDDPWRLPGRV